MINRIVLKPGEVRDLGDVRTHLPKPETGKLQQSEIEEFAKTVNGCRRHSLVYVETRTSTRGIGMASAYLGAALRHVHRLLGGIIMHRNTNDSRLGGTGNRIRSSWSAKSVRGLRSMFGLGGSTYR